MTFGNYILINLLVAIIVDGFVEVKSIQTILQNFEDKKILFIFQDVANDSVSESIKNEEKYEEINLNKENEYETINGLSNCEIIEESRDGQINVNAAKINPEDKEISKSVPLKYNFFEKRADYSLYLFSKENFLRKFCSFITLHKWFETVTLIFVGLNCLMKYRKKIN